MPSNLEIFKYWDGRGVFRELHSGLCFACTSAKPLERAHLIPDCAGGRAVVSNLVLLCKRCHGQAPMIGVSENPMIKWINRREHEVSWIVSQVFAECKSAGVMQAIEDGLPDGFDELFQRKMLDMNPYPHLTGEPFSTMAAVAASVLEDARLEQIPSPS